jgi:alkanesulfonate monooxygenase SsuD/methylene tetrahydromethanopterin reductase-like flavin-dependent oxidoreductase (luciferase family)
MPRGAREVAEVRVVVGLSAHEHISRAGGEVHRRGVRLDLPAHLADLPLMAVSSVIDRIRWCPLVVNDDFHHPVDLAREIVALDHLTGGRMELGLGAGHSFSELRRRR